MSDQTSWVTCTVAPDLAQAELVASYLRAAGLSPLIPDAMTAGVAWHLTNAMQGVRVQVPPEQLERAREALASFEDEASAATSDDEAAEISPAERLAMRAFRIAVVGTLLIIFTPVIHPYAFSLSLDALKQRHQLSPMARRKAWIACGLSLTCMVLFLVFLKSVFLR
jgi:hypothetical protein